MAKNPHREYDNTHLSLDFAEQRLILHRDFLSHSLRWSHIVKWLMQGHKYQDCHILDVGCGKDTPLPRLMYANRMSGFSYSGIDINPLDFHPTLTKAHQNGKAQISLHEQTDASILPPEDLAWGLGDVLVALEILEHIAPYIVCRMLKHWKNLLQPDAVLFVSTPVFNGSAADNHISEWSRQTLGSAFEYHGYTIIGNYGTFASQSDLVPHLTKDELAVYDRLKTYYDTNALSVMLAPLHPEGSRNNMWVLRNKTPDMDKLRFWNKDGTVDFGVDQHPDAREIIHGKGL
jgi:2-polyprenyl-3-methyl-5-hydroxy-6-metoxy-1,4-benzoquinol methylase